MKKLTAISALRNFDHELIGQEDIDKICEPFGVHIDGFKWYEDYTTNPKGLRLNPGPHVKEDKKGRYALGLEASVLATLLCSRLGVKYEGKMGRGSQLRSCCDALEEKYANE